MAPLYLHASAWWLILACLSLMQLCSRAELTGYHLVTEDSVNWDNSTYHPTRVSNSKTYYASATYYEFKNGSTGMCGFPENYLSLELNYMIAATPFPRFGNPLTPGFSNFTGAACGQCYHLKCAERPRYAHMVFCKPGPGITVRITDWDYPKDTTGGIGNYPKTGGWPANHFDLSPMAYSALADPSSGIINVKFKRVQCKSTVAPRWTIFEDSNNYWRDVGVFDVGDVGAILAVYAIPTNSTTVFKLEWSWGSHYQFAQPEYLILDGNSQVWALLAEGRGNVTASYAPIKTLKISPPSAPSPPEPPPLTHPLPPNPPTPSPAYSTPLTPTLPPSGKRN